MKKILYVVMLGIMVTMAGCSQKNNPAPDKTAEEAPADGSTAEEGNTDNKENEQPQTSTEENDTEDTTGDDTILYYGDWVIDSSLGTNIAYAMSPEEIEAEIGTELSYSSDSFSYNGNDIEHNGYKEETMSKETFENDFKVRLSALGIDNNELTRVIVQQEGNFFGGMFYVIEENRLVIYQEGVYFDAVRK